MGKDRVAMTIRSGYNSNSNSSLNISGFYRGIVKSVGSGVVSLVIPNLSGPTTVYENIKYVGFLPSVDDYVWVSFIEGKAKNPLAFSLDTVSTGDITAVTAGTALSGGGSSGDVTLNFAPSELSSVTVAADDKVVIADTSDSDNPKHVTAQSIANLAPQGDVTSITAGTNLNGGGSSGDVTLNLDNDISIATATFSSGSPLVFEGATADAHETTFAITDPTADRTITFKDGTGTVAFTSDITTTSPAGSDHDVQFNNSGSFGADSNFTYDGSKVTIKAALDVGVDDTGHDVIFYGATTTNSYFWWDESADALKLGPDSPLFANGRIQTGQQSFTQEPWSDSTIALGAFGGIGTQGSYRTSLSWNWERGTDSAFHHLDINSYPQAGAVEIGNGGILFEFDDDYETTHTDHPVIRARITSDGLILGSGTTGPILSEGTANTLRIENGDGYIDIGAMNSGAEHIYASAATLFLGVNGNAEVRLNSTEFSPSSDEGTNLGSQSYTWNKFWLGQAATFSSGGYYTLRSRDSDRQVMELVSSERYKKDIEDLPLSEAYQVLDARVIKYRGVDDDETVPLEVGLSAESLHEAGYEYAVRYDEGHWGETPRSVYYEYLTAPLIAIIKDLKARIEVLEG